MGELLAWLAKYKRYPRKAKIRRQQGTAMLYFEMDRKGRVLSYELQESSGYRLLDQEALALIKRAEPLPAMPSSMTQAQLELVVPIRFNLR